VSVLDISCRNRDVIWRHLVWFVVTESKTKTVKETKWDWELLNDAKAVWLRNPKDVTEEEYSKFYHSLAKVGLCPRYSSLLDLEFSFRRSMCSSSVREPLGPGVRRL